MYAEIADVRNDMNLELPKPKPNVHIVTVEPTEAMDEINREIVNMVKNHDGSYFGIQLNSDQAAKYPWSLTATTLSTKASISPRLVFPELEDGDGGKIHSLCEEIAAMYKKFDAQKGTQLVFCDYGVPQKGKPYDAYSDVKDRLVKDYGIPSSEIVDIHTANTAEKRKALFQKVNQGTVRILIGGTKNLGTGVNVQERLIAIHHLDIPWTPADREQREGRIVRQGNKIAKDFNDNKAEIFYYATKGSLDMYRYQLQDIKGKMFTQFKMNTISSDGREFEEGSGDAENGLDPAQMVAILSGNPVIFEKSKQDKLVKKLRRQEAAEHSDYIRRQRNYNDARQTKANMERLLSQNGRDVEKLRNAGFVADDKGTYPNDYTVEDANGVHSFEKASEAGKYMHDMLKKGKPFKISGYGYTAHVENDMGNGGDLFKKTLVLDNESYSYTPIRYTVAFSDNDVAAGQAYRNLLERVIKNNVVYKSSIEDAERKLQGADKMGEFHFSKQKQLENAIARKKELDAEYKRLSDDEKPQEESDNENDAKLYRTSEQLNEQYPTWLSGQTTSTGQHTTQITSTVATYEKIGQHLLSEGKKPEEVSVLDASSGLGVGTQALRDMGFDVEDVEPYPSSEREAPTYEKYEDVKKKKYDVVISNAVLNVIPDDWRADVLKSMADKLKVGGRLFINVRDAADIKAQKQKIELDSSSEILVTDKQGNIRAYQKGFTRQELADYVREQLGDSFEVETAKAKNSGIGGATAVVVTRMNNAPLEYRRLGDGAVSDERISYEADLWSKMIGQSQRTARQQREFAERERQRMRSKVKALTETLHIGDRVEMVEDVSVLTDPQDRKAKGFYDPRTGRITIVVPNHVSVADVEQTLLHEAVAHYGLRQLFGDHFNMFLNNVYAHADVSIRQQILEVAKANGWDIRTATEEYLACLAERTNFENTSASWWQKIKHLFVEMLHSLGFEGYKGETITDNELRYVLWRSYEHLKGTRPDLVSVARDVAKQAELQVGNYAPRGADSSAAAEPAQGLRLPKEEYGQVMHAIANNGFENKNGEGFVFTDKKVYFYHVEENGNEIITHATSIDQDIEELINDDDYTTTNRRMRQSGRSVKADVLLDSGRSEEAHGQDRQDSRLGEGRDERGDAQDLGGDGREARGTDAVGRGGKLYRSTIANPAGGVARDYYERKTRKTKLIDSKDVKGKTESVLWRMGKAYGDSMAALKAFTDGVLKETGGTMHSFEDAYKAENALSSMNKTQQEAWERDYFKPIEQLVTVLMQTGHSTYDDLKMYIVAKHGLERNEVLAQRDFAAYQKAHPQGAKTLDDFRRSDYSGLTALTGETDVADAEAAAQQIVAAYEQQHGKQLCDEWWTAVNAATKSSLQTRYNSGLMSKAAYEHVHDMFQYYIPLKGWDSNVAAKEYEYMAGSRAATGSPKMVTAKGRPSLADDPIATIGADACMAIQQSNRNLMKRKFLNFVVNNPTSLTTLAHQWYVLNAATGEWTANEPTIPTDATGDQIAQIVAQHEQQMQALKAQGLAEYRRGYLNLGLNTTATQQSEHKVKVLASGEERVIYINGNPMVAQAVNGVTNPDVHTGKAEALWKQLQGRFATVLTSKNPAFVLSNLAMDTLQAAAYTGIRERGAYNVKAMQNAVKVFGKALMPQLVHKWNSGTLDLTRDVECYFDEFMRYGGETGFTQLNTVENVKRDIARFVKEAQGGVATLPRKAWRSVWDGVEFLNRSAEDTNRFICYMTSRQMGRDVARSIWDAKDITVNFNKKGDGGMGAQQMKWAYVFFNAAIQSLRGFGKTVAANPAKATAVIGSFAGAGFLIPMLNMAMVGLCQALGGGGGGDDDGAETDAMQWYWDLPEWQRRNNVVLYIPFTRGSYFLIPLPHELRGFYGAGECAFTAYSGHQSVGDAIADAATNFNTMLPLDFTGNGGNVLLNLTPSLAQPVAQVVANKDYFGKPVYRRSDYGQYDPEWTKAYKGTSGLAIALSKFWGSIGNDNPDIHKQAWDGWWSNPDVMEHLVSSYFGGVGKTVLQTYKTTSMLWDDELRQLRNVPVASRFLTTVDERSSGSDVNSRYYEAMDEYRQTESDLSKMKRKTRLGVVDYARRLADFMESDEYRRYRAVKDYEDAIAPLRSELKNITDPSDAEAVSRAIQTVKVRMIETLRDEEAAGYPARPEKHDYMTRDMDEALRPVERSLTKLNRCRLKNDDGSRTERVHAAEERFIEAVEQFNDKTSGGSK